MSEILGFETRWLYIFLILLIVAERLFELRLADVSAGVSWIDDWFSADLNIQYVDSAQDSEDGRFDNSMLGVVAGNWSIAAPSPAADQ